MTGSFHRQQAGFDFRPWRAFVWVLEKLCVASIKFRALSFGQLDVLRMFRNAVPDCLGHTNPFLDGEV